MARLSFTEAIREALAEEMRHDPRVFLMGEDVTWNILGSTGGLADEFGLERVRDTPIAEAGFAGAGVGAALAGMRPVVDFLMAPFLYVAMDQLVSIAAKSTYLYGGQARIPVVFKAVMEYGNSNAAQHSDRPYSMFMNTPGLKIAVPASAADAYGLLKTAIRDDDPVLFFEDATLWTGREEVPAGTDFTVPFGQARTWREGDDVTIVCIGGAIRNSLMAAELLADEGIGAEVIDPRTLVPLDIDAIYASVRKTGRLVVADPANQTCSAASEIAALVSAACFDDLRAPVQRVTVPNTHVPFSAKLEAPLYPTVERIASAARLTASWRRSLNLAGARSSAGMLRPLSVSGPAAVDRPGKVVMIVSPSALKELPTASTEVAETGMKKIGFLSFGHWSQSAGSQVRSASDSLLQSIELAVAAEELGADGAYFRVHHFASQLGSPFPLLAAVGAKTSEIEIGTAVIDMRFENPMYFAEDAGAADLIAGGRLQVGISRGSPGQVIDGWSYFGYQPAEGQTDADMARTHAEVLLTVLKGEGFAEPNPRPLFPNPPGLLRVEPYSVGLRDRIWWGAASQATAKWAAQQGMNLQSSTLISHESDKPFHVQQAEQIQVYRDAWKEASHERQPRVSVSRSIFALTEERDRRYFGVRNENKDHVGFLDAGTQAIFGRTYAAEPDKLIAQLKEDEAIAAADTLLLTVPNQLGVEYNAHAIESILTHVAPALGWR